MVDVSELIAMCFTYFIASAFCWVIALDMIFDVWGDWTARAFGVIVLICALAFTGATIAFGHDVVAYYGWI